MGETSQDQEIFIGSPQSRWQIAKDRSSPTTNKDRPSAIADDAANIEPPNSSWEFDEVQDPAPSWGEPHTREVEDKTRRTFTTVAIMLFAGISAGIVLIAGAFVRWPIDGVDAMEALKLFHERAGQVFTGVIGVVGTVAGFYFGSKSK